MASAGALPDLMNALADVYVVRVASSGRGGADTSLREGSVAQVGLAGGPHGTDDFSPTWVRQARAMKSKPIPVWLRDPALARAALVINEIGEVGLDNTLVAFVVDSASVLTGLVCVVLAIPYLHRQMMRCCHQLAQPCIRMPCMRTLCPPRRLTTWPRCRPS